jgi:mono/diheme cytochrome c family protein
VLGQAIGTMCPPPVRPARSSRIGAALGILAGLACALSAPGRAEEGLTNPFRGQAEAIAAGRDIYRSKCYICHHSSGARGPNIFATKLTDEQFLETVINGRKGTQMPAFGERLSPDEVWQVHAFVKSTDHY